MSRVRLFLRSLFVAGSWNYRDLLSVGLSWALLPETPGDRGIAPDNDESAGGGHFNAHPYLVPLAVGVLARATRDGADAPLVQRLKDALRGPLGSLGDQLFWGAWRPICLVLAAVGVLVGFPPIVSIVGLLVVYNATNLGLRWWGMNAGLSAGLEVGAALRRVDLPARTERVKAAGVLVFGGLVGIVAMEAGAAGLGPEASAVGVLVFVFGFLTRGLLRQWIPLFIVIAAALGLWGPGLSGGAG